MFSERLVESINMVRELLKSNKELREKLEMSNARNDEKDLEIFEVSRENQMFKEKMQSPSSMQEQGPTLSQTAIRTSIAMVKKRHSSTAQRTQLHHHATEHHHPQQPPQQHPQQHPQQQPPSPSHQNLVGSGGMMAFSSGGSRNNFNYWNSVEINQYIMNERGIDSVPTNFSRK